MRFPMALFALAGVMAVSTTHADELSYTYWEAGYIRADIDGLDSNPDGFFLGLSVELTDRVFVFGGYAEVDTDIDGFDVNETDYSVGIGYAWPLRENLDITGRVAYLGAEADGAGLSVDDDGYGLGIGLRGRFVDRLELTGGVQYSDFSDLGDDTSLGLAAHWFFTDQLAVGIYGSFSDDVTNYGIGVRGAWGRN